MPLFFIRKLFANKIPEGKRKKRNAMHSIKIIEQI